MSHLCDRAALTLSKLPPTYLNASDLLVYLIGYLEPRYNTTVDTKPLDRAHAMHDLQAAAEKHPLPF